MDASSGTFVITVQDISVVVASAELANSGPVVIVQPVNWRLYTGIGAGLGAVLLLVIVVTITMGVVLYMYRRYVHVDNTCGAVLSPCIVLGVMPD